MNSALRKSLRLVVLAVILLSGPLADSQNNPPLQVIIYDSSATSGYIFLAPYVLSPPYTYDHPQMILDRYGNTVYYRVFLNGGIAATTADFKLQSNGLMSFFSPVLGKFYLMDSTFTVTDSVSAVNGYETDTHELQILSDGHYLILGRETRIMNLLAYRWFGSNHNLPGSPNAQVTGSVIQELDENKNLVFEWKSHDHFSFGDVDSVWLSSPTNVDWTHSNALERDYDGNILLSSRHLNEITKINRNTGAIMWRLGGKHNQFTFDNDTIGFTGQHDIRRQANGHVTLWDNGQYTDPPVGRALEFSLNENTHVAHLEFGYIQDSGMFSYAMGNHQRLPGNDRFLTYGFITPPYPMIAHIRNDSTPVMEVFGPPGYGCYRAFHYDSIPFTIPRPAVHCELTGNNWYLVAESGHPEYLWSTGETTQSIPVTATGRYQVFVPYGNGHSGSEVITVQNIANPCATTPVPTVRNIESALVAPDQSLCYDATQTIQVAGNGGSFEVLTGGTADFIAGQKIRFYPGLNVHSGGYMHGRITTTGNYCPPQQVNSMLPNPLAGEPQISLPDDHFFTVYPNPCSGYLTVKLDSTPPDNRISITVCDLQGRMVYQEDFSTKTLQSEFRIPADNWPIGIWLLRIVSENRTGCVKIIKTNR